ncbi:MAG: hypothetical protein HOP07_03525 [Bacteriovoracaceae bacterium]|nr:hypothetical protein [Bacteriovoracaceae bacterium]
MEEKSKLESEYQQLLVRIKHLEKDLQTPLSRDPEELAVELINRNITYSLYQVEKQNLQKIVNDLKNYPS